LISLLLSSFLLMVTVVLALAAGIGMGYLIIFGILHAFDRSRQALRPAPVVVLNATVSGH
jgi:hypothetical protein